MAYTFYFIFPFFGAVDIDDWLWLAVDWSPSLTTYRDHSSNKSHIYSFCRQLAFSLRKFNSLFF
jgi:hypothetical protein